MLLNCITDARYKHERLCNEYVTVFDYLLLIIKKKDKMKKIIIVLVLSLFTTIANADGHAKANAFAITLKVPASDIAKVEEMLKTHHKWMKETHPMTGEKKLNSYSVIKGPEWNNPADPSQGMTGNMYFILTEYYENPAGFQNHQELGSKWPMIQEFQQMLFSYVVGYTFPGTTVVTIK